MPQSVVLDDSPSYRPPREYRRKHPLATMTDTPLTPELPPGTHPLRPTERAQQSSGRAIVGFTRSPDRLRQRDELQYRYRAVREPPHG